NGDLTGLGTVPNNGDVDVASLPSDRVVVAVESFCRLSCSGPTTETALPLDWTAAVPLTPTQPPTGKHELALGFRWFDAPLFVVARCVRPDPSPPAMGEYAGWDGIGPLSAIGVGSVSLRPLPPGAVLRPTGQI